MHVATMTMLPALQAASSVGADAPDEPRFSLVDGRYHESEQADDGEGATQGGTALALRGISALAVQRGKPLCSIPKENGWTRRHHLRCMFSNFVNSWLFGSSSGYALSAQMAPSSRRATTLACEGRDGLPRGMRLT